MTKEETYRIMVADRVAWAQDTAMKQLGIVGPGFTHEQTLAIDQRMYHLIGLMPPLEFHPRQLKITPKNEVYIPSSEITLEDHVEQLPR